MKFPNRLIQQAKKMDYKRNCFSYWFPKIVNLGIPHPKTMFTDINRLDKNFEAVMKKVFWMKELTKEEIKTLQKFRQLLEFAGSKIGYPLFLRSGQTSHKHEWLDTCYIKDKETLIQNAQNIAEYNIMAGVPVGFPINVWVIRKLIKITPIFYAFNKMPITKEIRVFIKNGKIQCIHPYWPEEAIKGHTEDKDWKVKLKAMNHLTKHELNKLELLNLRVALNFKDYWSVDWLKGDDKKWYLIDMATGKDSYHYPNCKYKKGK
jgi:hypothetical protein